MSEKIKLLWKRWAALGKRIATFQIKVLCTLAYIIFITPFGILFRFFIRFPKAGWQKVKPEKITLEKARRQF
ncbi:hypothetical protein KJ577_08025 [bacterium]|nr:hypothetical protein [bacterium]